MKALITGFEPFGEESMNPSTEILKRLPDHIGECEIITETIPTVFNQSIKILEAFIMEMEPNFVICLGQAGGAFGISVEKIGINLNEARIPDNEGQQPMDEWIYVDGQNAYFSSLPIKAIVKRMHEQDIRAKISYSAGTFVCNHLLYGLLYLIDTRFSHIRGGFIHVPFLSQQIIGKGDKPFMTLDMMTEAVIIAIKTTAKYTKDISENLEIIFNKINKYLKK
jgi:pyroglutamyl-peptidase